MITKLYVSLSIKHSQVLAAIDCVHLVACEVWYQVIAKYVEKEVVASKGQKFLF